MAAARGLYLLAFLQRCLSCDAVSHRKRGARALGQPDAARTHRPHTYKAAARAICAELRSALHKQQRPSSTPAEEAAAAARTTTK